MTYGMKNHLTSIDNDYEKMASDLLGKPSVLRENIATPFLTEETREPIARTPNPDAVLNPKV